MTTTARTTPTILVCAAAIGLIADYLLRADNPGINVPIAAALLAAAGLAMPSSTPRSPWPWLASLFFASMFAIRDTESVLVIDLLAALALASLPLLTERSIQLRLVHLVDLVTAPFGPIRAATLGTLDFVQHARTNIEPAPEARRNTRAIAVGAALAIPLVLVFGGLFASADPVFDTAVSSVIDGGLGPLLSHTMVIGALSIASAGYLWTLARAPREYRPLVSLPEIGGLQIQTPLVITVALFATFVGVQARSMFGGAEFVETTTGLTFAEYARGGFFQLVFASMLVLPMVYFAPVLAGPLDERAERRLRLTMLVQLALTALVLLSALWRMALYIRMYGLTEDRVNSTAIMLWIAATLGIFAVTVARGRPERAAWGALVAAVVVLAALNLANPAVMIAQYNLTHQNGREIDFKHLGRLGGDAAPVLVSHFDLVPEADRCRVVAQLRERHGKPDTDWRSWNLARVRASAAVDSLPQPNCPPISDPAGATTIP